MLILINDGGWLTEESVSDVAKLDVFIVVDRRVAAAATGSDCGLIDFQEIANSRISAHAGIVTMWPG